MCRRGRQFRGRGGVLSNTIKLVASAIPKCYPEGEAESSSNQPLSPVRASVTLPH
jgi:hypothetical protein